MDKYAANLDKATSLALKFEFSSEGTDEIAHKQYPRSRNTCDFRCDGKRASARSLKWREDLQRRAAGKSGYVSFTWDGDRYITYRQPDPNQPGHAYIGDMRSMDAKQRQWEIDTLQYGYDAAVLMGRYPGNLKRIDEILRAASVVRVRDSMEVVNDNPCYVIEGQALNVNYIVWVDPAHGFNIAKVHIVSGRDEGHPHYGQPDRETFWSFTIDDIHFCEVQGAWLAVEGNYRARTEIDGAKPSVSLMKAHIKIDEITLNPDHEALRSFTGGDIPNGTEILVVPVFYIRYLWADGELVTKIDEKAVRRIDRIVAELTPADRAGAATPATVEVGDANEADSEIEIEAHKPDPRAVILPRPYCGLYCLYSALKLRGQDADFRDLVKLEYVGSAQGSTMAELSKAARDHNLFAGVAARLTTRGLRQSPYPAILHVKANSYHPVYDHYELFLGTEGGQAKLFDPPEPPRLVPFRELASRWDGYALALSDKPFEVDAIFGPDRQRLSRYGALGALAVVALHLLMRRIPLAQGARPRRRQLAFSLVQAAALGALALLAGGIYHLTAEEGFIANGQVTASFQKAYLGGFIRKVGVREVRKLLGNDTVLIDARHEEDYESGHLPGAINLPIDSNEAKWQETMTPIPKDASIVVYCQSAGCKFARQVASMLVEDGYAHVRVFKGGWAEWVARHGESATEKTPKEQGAEPDGAAVEPAGPNDTHGSE